jgi:hypothetical protein
MRGRVNAPDDRPHGVTPLDPDQEMDDHEATAADSGRSAFDRRRNMRKIYAVTY